MRIRESKNKAYPGRSNRVEPIRVTLISTRCSRKVQPVFNRLEDTDPCNFSISRELRRVFPRFLHFPSLPTILEVTTRLSSSPPNAPPFLRPQKPTRSGLYMQKVRIQRESTPQTDVVQSQPWREDGPVKPVHGERKVRNCYTTRSPTASYIRNTEATPSRKSRRSGGSPAWIQASSHIELGTPDVFYPALSHYNASAVGPRVRRWVRHVGPECTIDSGRYLDPP